jgi:Zn-dependent protease
MRSIRVGSMFGVEVRVHWTIVVIFGLFMWDFATLALPKIVPGYPTIAYWSVSALATAAFMLTLAAHEMSHSFVARRHGIAVRDITLWMLGGISTIEGSPATPRDECAIAAAGPAVSAVIGVLGTVAGMVSATAGAPRIVAAGILWVAMFNLLLAVFNLVPAAPLDGGRILRSWLWHRSGDRRDATTKAARAGERFAWILLGAGAAELAISRDVGGFWILAVGWFLLHAARGERRDAYQDTSPGDHGTLCSPATQPVSSE